MNACVALLSLDLFPSLTVKLYCWIGDGMFSHAQDGERDVLSLLRAPMRPLLARAFRRVYFSRCSCVGKREMARLHERLVEEYVVVPGLSAYYLLESLGKVARGEG